MVKENKKKIQGDSFLCEVELMSLTKVPLTVPASITRMYKKYSSICFQNVFKMLYKYLKCNFWQHFVKIFKKDLFATYVNIFKYSSICKKSFLNHWLNYKFFSNLHILKMLRIGLLKIFVCYLGTKKLWCKLSRSQKKSVKSNLLRCDLEKYIICGICRKIQPLFPVYVLSLNLVWMQSL